MYGKRWLTFLIFLTGAQLTFGQEYIPGREIICPLDPHENEFKIESPIKRSDGEVSFLRLHTANIVVNYHGFTPEAQRAFQYAVDIWASLLETDVPIYVDAHWRSMGSNVLGSSRTTRYYRNFDNAPIPLVYYPVALAEKLAGRNLNPVGEADISTTFNSDFSGWYLGTDGNSSGRYDFVTIVLHELAHGLGFSASGVTYDENGSDWTLGNGAPGMYTPFIENGSGRNILFVPNNSSELSDYIQSNNLFIGTSSIESANGGHPAKLYCPLTYDNGASLSHWDDATFNNTENALMTHALARGESIHDPGPITLGLLKDMGWSTPVAPVNDDITVTDFTLSDDSITPGGEVNLTCNQQYNGPTPNSSLGDPSVGYYLSKDILLDDADVFLGDDLSTLGSDMRSESENESVTIPLNTVPGDYFILFVGDYLDVVDEIHESNNVEYLSLTIEPFFLTVDPANQNVPSESGSFSFAVDTNLDIFTISEESDWFEATAIDDEITVNYESNTSLQPRTAEIIVSGSSVSDVIISVIQEAGDPYLTVSPHVKNVGYESGYVKYFVNTNLPEFQVTSANSWLSLTKTQDSILVGFNENKTLNERTGRIVVSGNNASDVEIRIVQEPGLPFLTINPDSKTVNHEGGNTTFSVNTNLPTFNISSEAPWLSLSKSGNEITAEVSENTAITSRNGTIKVSGNGISEQILSITQQAAPAFLNVSKTSVNAPNTSGSSTFDVLTNLPDFNIDVDVNWLGLSISDKTITLNYPANTTINSRQAKISVSGNGVPVKIITLTQAAGDPFLTATPVFRNVGYSASSTSFSVETNLSNFQIQTSSNWLTLTKNGNKIQVDVKENKTIKERKGKIVVSGNSVANVELTIRQAAGLPFLTISPSSKTVGHQQGETSFSISTNLSNFDISSNAGWINASRSGNEILVNFNKNNSISQRNASIKLIGDGVSEKNIAITQQGAPPYLNVSTNRINANKGNGSASFQVNSNLPTFDVDVNVDWIQFTKNGKTINLTYDANPTVAQRQGKINISGDGVSSRVVTLVQKAGDPVLEISNLSRNISSEQETLTYSVNTNLSDITLSENADWLEVVSKSTKQIKILCKENLSIYKRTATVMASGAGLEDIQLKIEQGGAEPYLEIGSFAKSVDHSAGSLNINIHTNLPDLQVSSNEYWISWEMGASILMIDYEENEEIVQREGEIILSGENISDQIISITQVGAPPYLTVSEKSLAVEKTQLQKSLTISTNLSEFEIIEDIDWINIHWDGTTLLMEIDENKTIFERSGNFSLSGKNVADVIISISQQQGDPFLVLTSDNLTVPQQSGDAAIPVETNLPEIELHTENDWLEVSVLDQNISITFDENSTFETRRGTVLVSGSYMADQVITISQEAAIPYLELLTKTLDIHAAGGEYEVVFETNLADLNLATQAEWIHFILMEGSILVTVDENQLFEGRQADLTISNSHIGERTVTLTQQATAPYLSVSGSEIFLESHAGEHTFDIVTNLADFSVTSEAEWITVDIENHSIHLNFDENDSLNDRSTSLFIQHEMIDNIVILIHQRGTVITSLLTEISQSFVAYPNPVRDRLWIDIPDQYLSSDIILSLHDISGKKLISNTTNYLSQKTLELELGSFKNGIYLLSISDADNTLLFHSKVVVK